MIEGIQLARPWLLALLLLVPLYALLRRHQRRRRTIRFPPLQHRVAPGGWRLWKQLAPQLELLVVALVVIGLAGPYEESRLDLIEDEGVDVMLVLDVSLSMLAEDLPPNRLEALRRIARDFVGRAGGNRIGIVIFAKDSYVQTPLTTDHRSLLALLDGVTVYTLDQNKSGGTSVGDALLVAVERLGRSRIPGRDQSLVLITDGESNTGIEPELAARYVRQQRIRFYAIGVGGTEPVAVIFEGNPIGAEGDYLAVLDDRRLKAVTELAGGRYYRATDVGVLERIFAELSRLESAPLELRTVASRRSYAHWPAIGALGLYLLYLALAGVFLEEPAAVIAFARPVLLLLALPWIGFWIWFARRQRRSCAWVWEHVHERFRERFTLYRPRSLGWRMAVLLLLGLLLVLAAAGPAVRGETAVRELASRVVLLLDGSASMLADDLAAAEGGETRFARGRAIAAELAGRLEGSRFALVVFSGVAALQLPMTADSATIDEAIGAASFHTFYRSSGSSFTAALDSALHFVEPGRGDLQAVLLSDGEQPFAESFEEPLAALAEAGVPVHAVAIGSRAGQTRLIFDFRDVVAGKEEKTVLREYTTRREDRHLKRIARATGGRFAVADDRAAERLAAAIEKRIAGAKTVRTEGWRDLSGVPLSLFLVGFLLEALIGGWRGRPQPGFDIERLGAGRPAAAAGVTLLLAVALASLACRDDSPLGRASRENERGIAADVLESWPQARVHYDRSRAFGVRPEIPAFNLARSVSLQEDWSEAHDLYQAALELSPGLAVAHYNDGHVLYRWGEAELDLEGCELERALELWGAASRRFAGAAELFGEEGAGHAEAVANLRFIGERVDQVEAACAPPPPSPAGGGGGGGGEGGSGDEGEAETGGGGGEGGNGGEGEGEAGGGGGESEGEGGGGGEGESEGGGPGAESEGAGGGEREPGSSGGGEGEEEDEGGDEEEAEGGGQGEDQGESGGGDDESEDGDEGQGEGDGDGAAGPPLTGEELEQIRQALERVGADRFADGRYHYRSLPEQFPREVWQNPEDEIWW